MPLVKIDYVVSFSSEDPENPASNLLVSDVKSKWLCNKGESSCSVVLQLKNACKIETITIGAYHVALIEVLVGLSENPNDPFQVLVPSCVLLSPGASRRGDAVESVRSFSALQLTEGARGRRWDRVRLVCSQPYNKHCQYGLAFVHISSPESPAPAPRASPRASLLDEVSSDDEEFRPGELFSQHQSSLDKQSTESQIRQASSQALNNLADVAAKLVKVPINKTNSKEQDVAGDRHSHRTRDDLLYTDEDDRPHRRTDSVMRQHGQRTRRETEHCDGNKEKRGTTTIKTKADRTGIQEKRQQEAGLDVTPKRNTVKENEELDKLVQTDKNKTPLKGVNDCENTGTSLTRHKRQRSDQKHEEPGPASSSPAEVLRGTVVTLSGYVNPRRAALRATALALGARYAQDWTPACTHLVCAFPNTPKLKAARAAGSPARAVSADWLERCHRERRRLPWRWFAVEPGLRRPEGARGADDTDDEADDVLPQRTKRRRGRSSDEPGPGPRPEGDADTDDEIDKVLRHRAKRRCSRSCDEPARDDGDESDVAGACDERPDDDSDDTVEDESGDRPGPVAVRPDKRLPHFWEGCTFVVSERLRRRDLLARYIRAYGGLALRPADAGGVGAVRYVVGDVGDVGGEAAGAVRVRPAWVWRAHRARRHAEPAPHELQPAT